MIGSTLLSILLVSLWVAAWLHWFFERELRQFLFSLSSENWRGGRDRQEVLMLPKDEFEVFLAAESFAPAFLRGLLGCPGCFSAHLAAPGALLAAAGFTVDWSTSVKFSDLLPSLIILPLVWAASAWIGHRLHNYL